MTQEKVRFCFNASQSLSREETRPPSEALLQSLPLLSMPSEKEPFYILINVIYYIYLLYILRERSTDGFYSQQ